MRKWIVDHPEIKGQFKLLASNEPPKGAYCEAPENFTREMEPYFVLIPMVTNTGHHAFAVKVDDAYHKRNELKKQADEFRVLEEHKIIQESLKAAEEKRYFNSLNPAQRFFKSIFGKTTDHPKTRAGKVASKFVLRSKFRGE